MGMERLPFTIRRVRSTEDLERACRVRSEAYGRHLPALRAPLRSPDALDRDPHTAVFLAEARQGGAALGTIRVQSSLGSALQIARDVPLPSSLCDGHAVEMTRLAVLPEAGTLVKLALFKVTYLHCVDIQARWIIIGARREPLIAQYQELGFEEVFDPPREFPLSYAGDLPHRVLAFDMAGAYARWSAAQHPLLPFMVQTEHPDLTLTVRRATAARRRS